MSDRLMRAAEAGTLTAVEFRARVTRHLRAALDAMELVTAAPSDAFDPVMRPLLDQLEPLDQFIHAIGYNERRQEDREDERERKVAAKRRDPTLEERVIWHDAEVQRLVEVIGADATGHFILPIQLTTLLRSFVRLLDAVPASAFEAARWENGGLLCEKDATVLGVAALMRERRSNQPHTEK